LQYLADDLVFGHAGRDAIESRPTLTSPAVEHVTVAALLILKDQPSLPFERGAMIEIIWRYGLARPGIHDWTPRSVCAEMGEDSQRDGNDRDHQYSDGTPCPMTFTVSREKWEREQASYYQNRNSQHYGRFN